MRFVGLVIMIESINNKASLVDKCLLLCAAFCTAPVIAIVVGGRSISFFDIFFVLSVVLIVPTCFRKSSFTICKNNAQKTFLIWLALSLVSCLFGVLYYINRQVWFDNALSYGVKTTIYLLYVLLLFNSNCKPKYILKGLEIGVIANLIWVDIDAIYYYLFGASLTNTIFKSYIIANNVRYGSIDTFEGALIRPGGFNTDPASIGLFAPFLLLSGLIKNKPWMVALAISSIVFSGSTTSLVCCFIAFAIYFVGIRLKRSKKRISVKVVLSVLAVSLVVVIASYHYMDAIVGRILMTYNRVNTVYVSGDMENVRVSFITQLPQAIMNQGVKFITGTGFNSSSEGYLFPNINSYTMQLRRSINNLPHDVENLYISYLLDNGIVGFAFFILMLYRLYKKAKNGMSAYESEESIMAFSSIIAIMLSSVFYHYTLYSFHILCWAAISMIGNDEFFAEKKVLL